MTARGPETGDGDAGPLAVLQRLRQSPPPPAQGERCEMCSVDIDNHHGHVVDSSSRRILCTCRPCYLLFRPEGAGAGRFRAIPDRHVALTEGTLTQEQWDRLQIPVGVAFFFYNSAAEQVVALYPSPAGATESLLELDEWDHLVHAEPLLGTMEPDVEACLVRQTDEGFACYLVPIDVCYELVGQLRMKWRGFDGGSEARAAIEQVFSDVAAKSRPAARERERSV